MVSILGTNKITSGPEVRFYGGESAEVKMDRQVYARMAALEERHWWFVARRRILADVLTRQADLPHSARILEAGCGTGGNLSMLARFGQVMAFEPDPEARALARRFGAFDVRAGRLPGGCVRRLGASR